MDAPVTQQSETSTRQSLLARWRHDCSDLQQFYSKLELSLASALPTNLTALANTPPEARTFGKKINSAFKGPQASKAHAELVPLRNLMAHANADVVQIGGEWFIVLRVADVALAMNARLIPEKEYKTFITNWKKMLKNALTDAAALTTQPAGHGNSTIKA